jgi:comEA protein
MRALRRFALLCCCAALLIFSAAAAKKKPPTQPININTASSSQLQQVPGIGPVTADKIIQMRKSYGTFKSVDDLTAIRGIGPKKMDKMRKYLTVTRPQPAGATHAKSCVNCAAGQKPRPPTKPASTTPSKSATSAPAPAKKATPPAPQPQDAEAEEEQ